MDDHRVHAGALELVHLVLGRHGEIGDRELPRGHRGEQLQHRLEALTLIVLRRHEEKDLRIEQLQRALELLLAAHLDRAVEPGRERILVPALSRVVILVLVLRERERHSVRHFGGTVEPHRRTPQDWQARGLAEARRVAEDDERLGPLRLSGSSRVGILDGGDDGDAVALGDCVTEAAARHPLPRRLTRWALGYWPIGCQTVFSSRKEAISQGLWTSARPRTTRLTLSAARRSSSGASPSAPQRSIAFTSMCEANTDASSAWLPVRRLTTPPGTSLVASASASSTAARGRFSDATATTAFPPTSGGNRRVTRPSSGGSSGASTATTPVGSGTVKLKYGPATGFEPPSTCGSLSAQPAYQTTRSIERSTSSRPPQNSANSATRASIISASRYRTWPRL